MSVFHGDCKDVLRGIASESVDMIYLDPPFYTQRVHNQKTRNNDAEYSFVDCWDSLDQYILFMKERLEECYRVLKKRGNIFLHCDKNASHHLRMLLDEVFGARNFRNEIIWSYKRWTSSSLSLQAQHQTIYFYGKTKHSKFKTLYTDYSASTNVDQILQARQRDFNGKSVYKTNHEGKIVWGKEKKGVALGDVWEIPYLNPKANERVGYPTQKPVLLLERIIEISTDIDDVVLDPFCGSGTALVAAKLLGRQYMGIDISADACKIAKERLDNPVKTVSNLINKGVSSYLTKSQMEYNILASLEAIPVQRNSGIDGFLRMHQGGQAIPIKIQAYGESLYEAEDKLIQAAKKRNCRYMILIRTHGEYSKPLFDQITQESSLFILDSLELSISNWFAGLENIVNSIVI
jgi:site-specific DNA-methyltransferase (adenine-specific)